jgi:hypothetical protein
MYELGKQDPLDVYKKLKEILQHNKKHFEENNWNGNFLTLIKDCKKKIDLNNISIKILKYYNNFNINI